MSKSLAGCQHIENILDSVFHIFIVFNFSKTETFLQCSDIVGSVTGRVSSLLRVGCWFVGVDWSFAHQLQLSPLTTSIILSSSKIQNGDILVPAYTGCSGHWPLSECCCFSKTESYHFSLSVSFS